MVPDDRMIYVNRKFERKRALTAEECLYDLPLIPQEKDIVRSLIAEDISFGFTDEARASFMAQFTETNKKLLAHSFVDAPEDIWLEN